MKKTKKLITLLLALAMFLSVAMVPSFAASKKVGTLQDAASMGTDALAHVVAWYTNNEPAMAPSELLGILEARK